MSAICLICLRLVPDGRNRAMHPSCAKRLFGTKHVPEIEIDPANLHLFGLEMAGHTTLSGVQRKIAMSHRGGALTVTAGGAGYILKPQEGRFPEVPQNEHLTMILAGLAGLDTPPLGLVELKDGSLGLLVRRFDRRADGSRVAMEDFCQLAEKPPSEKYDSSAETCARIVNRYVEEALVDQRILFRLFLISWWLGNGDLHLKNISLLTREPRRPRLSPVYDLVNTSVIIPGDQLALPLCGKRSGLKPRDWIEFGSYCGLPREVIAQEAKQVVDRAKDGLAYVRRSFLTDRLKQEYSMGLGERCLEIGDLAREALAGTSKRRRTGPIARTVHLTQEAFEQVELDLSRTPLGEDLKHVEWLARWEPLIWDERGAYGQDQERTRRAFTAYLRLDRVQRALRACSQMAGFPGLARHLRNLTVGSRGSQETEAWAHLFEIELAAYLKAKQWTVEFRDTDLVLSGADEFGVECKRPAKEKTIVGNVKRGCQQLIARGLAGFVAVDLSSILPDYIVDEDGSFQSQSQRWMRAVIDRQGDGLARVMPTTILDDSGLNGAVVGVLFCATFLVLSKQEGGWRPFVHFSTKAFANPAEPGLLEAMQFFEAVVAVGQMQLTLPA